MIILVVDVGKSSCQIEVRKLVEKYARKQRTRKDILQRHMKIRKDFVTLQEEEVKNELQERHNIKMKREAKREIAKEEGLSNPSGQKY